MLSTAKIFVIKKDLIAYVSNRLARSFVGDESGIKLICFSKSLGFGKIDLTVELIGEAKTIFVGWPGSVAIRVRITSKENRW